jgi:hypothetical protein
VAKVRAFVVLRLDASASPPVVSMVAVHNKPWQSLTLEHRSGDCYVTLGFAEGETYEGARANAIAALAMSEATKWAADWLTRAEGSWQTEAETRPRHSDPLLADWDWDPEKTPPGLPTGPPTRDDKPDEPDKPPSQ